MEALLKTFDLTPVDGYMILVVAVLFVLLWRTLDRVLFTPYLNLIDAREQATVGVEAEAQKAYVKAEVGAQEYEGKIGEARRIAMEKKLVVLDSAKKEADSIVEAAENQAEKIILAAREQTKRDAEAAKKSAFVTAEALAVEMTAKLRTPPTVVETSLN